MALILAFLADIKMGWYVVQFEIKDPLTVFYFLRISNAMQLDTQLFFPCLLKLSVRMATLTKFFEFAKSMAFFRAVSSAVSEELLEFALKLVIVLDLK